MNDRVELPCTRCGFATVQLNLKGLLKLIPAAVMMAAKGAARFAGGKLDVDDASPTFGHDPLDVAKLLNVVCIECADRDAGLQGCGPQVDNNPGETS